MMSSRVRTALFAAPSNLLTMVAVSPPASATEASLWPTEPSMLAKSLSRLNGDIFLAPVLTTKLVLKSTISLVVNNAPHFSHARLRQTWCKRFCWRELVTFVDPPQYIHTMSIYCHNPIPLASGKVTENCGEYLG